MSGSYANIREGAMNPSVGGAAGYEQMLLAQFQQAADAERALALQAREAQLQAALDRSGAYQVGRMMLPQDPGEMALGAAMVPGPMGLGMRGVLAALGGMTTAPADAEGAFLPRSWFEALRRSRLPAARQEGERALEALSGVQNRVDIERMRWAEPAEQNQMFRDLAPETWEAGWLPYGSDRWMGALNPQRDRDYTNLDALVQNWMPARLRAEDAVYDPVFWEAADRALNTGQRGRSVRIDPNEIGGFYDSSDTGDIVVGLRDLQTYPARNVFHHEQQHSVIDRAGLRYQGGGPGHTYDFNSPELRREYLDAAGGNMFQAADSMYYAEPGEWLARFAERVNSPYSVIGQESNFGDEFARLPDFRVR